MSCFICQAFSENSPSNPQLAQECPATPLSSLRSLHHLPIPPLALLFFLVSLHFSSSSSLPEPFFFISSLHRGPLYLSVCSSFQGMAVGKGASVGRGVGRCQSSQTARCKHKELLWRWDHIWLNWICSLCLHRLLFYYFSLCPYLLFFSVLLFFHAQHSPVNLIFPPQSFKLSGVYLSQ